MQDSDLSRLKEKTMKLTRVMLACTLLLLASVPAFALPKCGECIMNVCVGSSESVQPCRHESGMCVYYNDNCTPHLTEPVLAGWTVASVEITCPAVDTEVVSAPEVTEVLETATTESK
jgi:hypothetical protein